MCGPNNATVKGNTTKTQDDAARQSAIDKLNERRNYMTDDEYQAALSHLQDPNNDANSFADAQATSQGFGITPPPDAPSLADKLVRQRRASQALSLTAGRGRRESFLGAYDGGSAAPRSTSALGGY
jgi:hypothetical protein